MKNNSVNGCCLVILVLGLLTPYCLTSPLSFEIASFESSNDVVLEGDANISESEIQLNRPTTKSVGRALYPTSFQLWEVDPTGNITRPADFTTHFSFNLSGAGAGAGGGGICFVLLPEESSSASWSSSSYGGLLGLFGSKDSALKGGTENRVVAVEFDTGLDLRWDPSSDHVGIDVNSIKSETYVNVSGGGFRNKGIGNVWVTYDSKAKNLSVVLVFAGSVDSSYRVSHIVDLGVVLPERVKVGFTASTGGAEIYRVLSWSFSSTMGESEKETVMNSSSPENQSKTKKGLEIAGLVCALVLIILFFCCMLKGGGSGGGRSGGSPIDKPAHPITVTATPANGPVTPTPANGPVTPTIAPEMAVATTPAISPVVAPNNHSNRVVAATDHPNMEQGPRQFTYLELSQATNEFTEKSKIGRGGFGVVYKGTIKNHDGTDLEIAVKKMVIESTSNPEKREIIKQFKAETEIIGQIRHKNVVRLVGWCVEGNDQLFVVYKFLQNRSLDRHLFSLESPVLLWSKRYEIACGLASGLHYLHEEYDRCVVHRDVKSSNVMLDSDFNPRIGDFGLARFTDHGKSVSYTDPAGTHGYMAPEIFKGEKAGKMTDVYSFGVVLLEITTGKRPLSTTSVPDKIEPLVTIEWVRHLSARNCILDAVDRRLGGYPFDKEQAKRLLELGLKCCDPEASKRPSMRKVTSRLRRT